ncbi:MAG: hypothetical protein IJ571_03185 [Ruminococcus sp.]|nr:hypothetical protein [Ruminococcus sp.]
MKMTSAQAAKVLRQLNDEHNTVLYRESSTRSFLASVGEDVGSVRPEYDYEATQAKLGEIETKIRKLKHALNVFNSTTVIPEYDMTIDEMLVYLPQLSQRCSKLSEMKDAIPKVRESAVYSRSSAIIDYRYANYDIEKAAQDHRDASNELAKAQTALDLINNTAELEIDL